LLLWAAQIPLAVVFVFFGLAHLPGGGIYTVAGTAELAGAIGLLTPWLAGLAAAGLAADMVGATIVTYGSMVWLTAPLCAVFVLPARAGGRERGPGGPPPRGKRAAAPGPADPPASDVMTMSLTEPETQALGAIADGLAGADPRLASMLTIFSRLAAGEEMPA